MENIDFSLNRLCKLFCILIIVCCLITLSVQTKLTTNLCNTKQNKTGSLGTNVAPINRFSLTHSHMAHMAGGEGVIAPPLTRFISFYLFANQSL